MAKYGHIASFKETMHGIHLHARLDLEWQWLPLPYRVQDEEIEKEIFDWDVSWWPPTIGSSIVLIVVPGRKAPPVSIETFPPSETRRWKDKPAVGTTPD